MISDCRFATADGGRVWPTFQREIGKWKAEIAL